MRDENTGTEDRRRRELMRLAEDILNDKVFTSRHLSAKTKSDEEWLASMLKIFTPQNLEMHMAQIRKDQEQMDLVMFYQYLHFNLNPDPEGLPIFKEAEYTTAEETKFVIDELKRLAIVRMNQ